MSNRGFSYIEVLLAAGIVVTGSLIGATMSKTNSKNLAYDRNTVVATEIASNILEDLLNRTYSDPDLAAGTHTYFYDQTEASVAAPSPYTATWTVTLGSPASNMMDIKLQISWSTLGSNQTVNFETYRSSD